MSQGHEQVCRGCGLVVDEKPIDHGPEWRFADQPENPLKGGKRCTGVETASTAPGTAGTEIGTYAERQRHSSDATPFLRLDKWHSRQDSNDQEVLNNALPEIKRICSVLSLRGQVVERACGLFRQAFKTDFLARRSVDTVTAACVYAACREHRIPRLPEDVADAMQLTQEDLDSETRKPKDTMLQTFRKMHQEEGISMEPFPMTALDYLPQYLSRVEADRPVRIRARRIAKSSIEAGAYSGSASSLAAASIYLSVLMDPEAEMTQTEVARHTDCSATTLRKIRNRLQSSLALDSIEVDCDAR